MARKVIDEWAFGSVVREGPEEFVNFPGSFAEYLIREAEESAKHCDMIGCVDQVAPGSEVCPAHQHAVATVEQHGSQVTVKCACGDVFGPIGSPDDRNGEANRADAHSQHVQHAESQPVAA